MAEGTVSFYSPNKNTVNFTTNFAMKMSQGKVVAWILLSSNVFLIASGFVVNGPSCSLGSRGRFHVVAASGDDESTQTTNNASAKENKAMAFLRKIGKVGGAANQDFMNSVGVDEGPAGKTSGGGTKHMRKAKSAYEECTKSGVVDDMTETFPFTSSGTEWAGFTDRVMGGMSSGSIERESVKGKPANILRGQVSLANNGGFVQMATDLALDPSVGVVDASQYDGLEIDVLFEGEDESAKFNIQ